MPDLERVPAPPRPELLRQLRTQLGDIQPGLRFVAERLLGADSPIDLLAVDPAGRAVLLLVGEPDGDLELLGRALAQRAWARARLADWAQLGPQLGLLPEAGAVAFLLCPHFRQETRLAAEALGADAPGLIRVRWLRRGESLELLLETELAPRAGAPEPTDPHPPGTARFRSGLSDEDLALTPEERAEFHPESLPEPPSGDAIFGTGDNS